MQSNSFAAGRLLAGAALAALMTLAAGAAPPEPWQARDLGVVPRPGATDVDANGVWTLKGTSGEPWQDNDQYHLATLAVKGDATLQARFLTLAGGNSEWGRVGLTVRANDTTGSPRTDLVVTRGHGLCDQSRFEQDRPAGPFLEVGATKRPEANLLLRLQRAGNDVAGYYSQDGLLWTQASPLQSQPSLPEEALFGLVVGSLDSAYTTGTLDGVQVQTGGALPYGIQTSGADGAVLVQWRPLRGAVGYHVYRGAKDATRDQLARLTSEPLTATSFADTSSDLVNGTAVRYAVAALFRAEDGSLAEGPPVAVLGMPIAVPEGMMGSSINEGPAHGSAAVDPATGVITVHGAGFWFNGNGDQGYYLSRMVEGDAQVTVRMLGKITGSGGNRFAGLMIRESLDRDARYAMIGRNGPSGGHHLVRLWRPTASDNTWGLLSHGGATIPGPVLLRLTRRGNAITPAYSLDDGKTFVTAPPITFATPLPPTLHVGLAITAGNGFDGNRSLMGQAQFSLPEIVKP
jgi:hypothetical protein